MRYVIKYPPSDDLTRAKADVASDVVVSAQLTLAEKAALPLELLEIDLEQDRLAITMTLTELSQNPNVSRNHFPLPESSWCMTLSSLDLASYKMETIGSTLS